ncbi:IMS domain-containing protein [Synechococcus sp. CBW1107]|uniref:IMS domain-containing protein n=1 Tax=Synechococcus sp. CBW1107 TaxID=2789857 RepID=UPI002AD1DB8D|nr:IMS domain-containing protein [Synechococcus sp. CBW1107]CAK6693743.1 hypothetical protein MNNICLKF_01487 [Synechococcus sp. CBW1107]
MELPIDHFRLLGVSPTTDGETVLRTLQQRLDRAPDQGFTHDTLQARAQLLQASADLLSDEERRPSYERELTAIADTGEGAIAALEIPPSREVGGLLLLMEAGQAQEAFEAASRGLQPPQAPALGSSREADLTLLAGIACQAAATDYRNQRRYEASARTLQQGLQLLQRMGQLPEQRRQLEHQLKTLLPYRVLDLISRDLSALSARQEGIGLLEQLVQQRGGLEGDLDSDFPQAEFQPFFKQIRQFLTVQEQVDLFSRWGDAGSATADFLASFALTAAGFMQRKPERIQAAFQRLKAGGQAGTEVFLACQQLLLGQVDQAQAMFDAGADEALRQWAEEQSDDPLARLCAYCRDWLSREVLPGFRDIEADVDLEAWFADRDVQAYVEQQDRIRARQTSPSPLASTPAPPAATSEELPAWPDFSFESAPEPDVLHSDDDDDLWDGPRWRLPALRLPEIPAITDLPRWALPAAGATVLVAALGGWLLLRPRPQTVQTLPVQPAEQSTAAAPEPAPEPPAPAFPLTSSDPSETQLQELLEAWLAAKAAVLAGQQPPVALTALARSSQVTLLQRQEQANRNAGATETVKAKVESFSVRERTPRRIAAEVTLQYSDQRRSTTGAVLSQTASTTLTNIYVFGRDGDRWLLAGFKPS